MGVILGVGCYFSAQADSKKPKKNQLMDRFSKNGRELRPNQPKASLQKVSTSSVDATGSLSLPVGNARPNEQDLKRNNLDELDKDLKKPSQDVGLKKLLKYASQEAKNCPEIDLNKVNRMFALTTELGYIENEVGIKFYGSKEKFLAAGIVQANNEQKLRVADIFSIRRGALRLLLQKERDQKMPDDIDELLKKQRSNRSLSIFHSASKILKQLGNESNEELFELQKKAKEDIENLLKKVEAEDKKFNTNQVYNDVLDFARKSNNNPEIIIYFSCLVQSTVKKKGPLKKKNEGFFWNK